MLKLTAYCGSILNNLVFLGREPPRVEIWPQEQAQAVQLGGEHTLICRVLGGIPEPDVTWNRNGGRPLSRFTEIRPHHELK